MNSFQSCLLTFLVFFNLVSGFSQSEIHRSGAVVTDYPVTDIQYSEGYSLLRGQFYQAGYYSGSVIALDMDGGAEVANWPVISGEVNVIIPDGNGGYYAGGSIRSVNNEDVGNLIHILPNRTLDRTWLPNPLGVVFSLALRDNILYAGGTFVTIAGQSRNYAAAFDLSSGQLTSWNPRPNNRVTAIEITDDAVFIAGYFTELNNGMVLRNRIAAVDKGNGNVINAWNVSLDGDDVSVNAMAASSNRLYFGGSFQTANGTNRNSLAAVSLTDGSLDVSWNPQPESTQTVFITDLTLSGTTLYVAGVFDSGIGGDITIRHLGAVSALGTGAAISEFHPVFDEFDQIQDIYLSGSVLYTHGLFNSVSGSTRIRFAALNATNGSPTAWAPEIEGNVLDLAVSGSNVFICGDIWGANWEVYNGLALVEENTGKFWPHSLALDTDEDINAIAVSGNTMYLGGAFTSVNGVARKNLAAIDLSTGNILPWNPGASGTSNTSFDDSRVTALELRDNVLYIAGIFLNVAGEPRRGLAAIDASTGDALPWNPPVGDGAISNGYIKSMDLHGDNLYVAGSFIRLAGQTRPYLGSVSVTTGALVEWHPAVLKEIQKVRVAGNDAFLLGDFSDGIGGTTRPYGIAAVDITTGLVTAFNPEFNSTATADFAISDTDIYVSGFFDLAGGEMRPGLASFSLSTGELNPWSPDLGSGVEGNYGVLTLAISPTRLFVGGNFVSVGNESREGYAEYDLEECSAVASITLDGTSLVAAEGDSYQWYENDVLVEGATSQHYSINIFEYGRYAVEVTDNGCSRRSNDYVYLVTEREEDPGSAIQFYPNPVTEDLFIRVPQSCGAIISDITGRCLYKSDLESGLTQTISTANWPKGTYILTIQNTRFAETYKIIKTN